jgi:molybdenum cofactor cytidylyltransferase
VIAAVVLAAGASRRMGRPKQLLPLPGGTVLSTVVSRLLESSVDRVVVVLGHEAEVIRRGSGLPADPRVAVVVNADHAEGMASSLRSGVAACADAEAVVVALGDQPGIEPSVVTRLVSAFRAGARLAVPVQGERRGHPVLFDRSLYAELLALRGDRGAREVVARHWPGAASVEAAIPSDLDTEEDYRAFSSSPAPRP